MEKIKMKNKMEKIKMKNKMESEMENKMKKNEMEKLLSMVFYGADNEETFISPIVILLPFFCEYVVKII
jgi:hypothetical protein